MKRTMIIVGGLLALATTAYVGTRLAAQGPATPAAPAQTRVAFVNIETVLQNYKKAVTYKEEMEKTIAPFRTDADTLKKDMIRWEQELNDPGSPTKIKEFNRERWAEAIKNNKRKLEDLTTKVGKIIGKKQEEQVVQLFSEVNEAVQRYALTNGFHVVMSYGQPSKVAPLSFENISRQLQGMGGTGCLSYMYIAPGLDISQAVIDMLNRGFTGGPTIVPTSGKGPN